MNELTNIYIKNPRMLRDGELDMLSRVNAKVTKKSQGSRSNNYGTIKYDLEVSMF